MLFSERKALLEKTLKETYPLIGELQDRFLFTHLELCDKGELETDDLRDYEAEPEPVAFLSLVETTMDFMDRYADLLGDRELVDEDEYANLRYFAALTRNLLTYVAIFNEGYYDYEATADDLNRLVAKDITQPTRILLYKDFCEMEKEEMIAWLEQRRYYKPMKQSKQPWVDTPQFDFSQSLVGRSQPSVGQLSCQLWDRAVHQNKTGEFMSQVRTGNFSQDIKSESFLASLAALFDLDLEGLKRAVQMCLNTEQSKAEGEKRKAEERKKLVQSLAGYGKITSEAVIDNLKAFGLRAHGKYRETKYIKPYQIQCEGFGVGTFVIEKTKTANLWVVAADARHKLEGLAMTEYPAITPTSTPYGRNSNLQKIDELAYANVMKFKIKTGEDLLKVLAFLLAA